VTEQRYVTYFRVSTDRQGRSGLGLEAQREAVRQFLAMRTATIIAEYVEIESGGRDDRPKLLEALAACHRTKTTLLIAKLDRLARSVSFVAGLMDGDVDFVAVDMPHASRFVLHIMAAVAEHERQIIGERTKAALAAAKTRGVRLGVNGVALADKHKAAALDYARNIAPVLLSAGRAGAVTSRQIADYLNKTGVPSRQNGLWHSSSVARLMKRLGSLALCPPEPSRFRSGEVSPVMDRSAHDSSTSLSISIDSRDIADLSPALRVYQG